MIKIIIKIIKHCISCIFNSLFNCFTCLLYTSETYRRNPTSVNFLKIVQQKEKEINKQIQKLKEIKTIIQNKKKQVIFCETLQKQEIRIEVCQSERILVYPYDFSQNDVSQIFYHLKDIWGIEQIRMGIGSFISLDNINKMHFDKYEGIYTIALNLSLIHIFALEEVHKHFSAPLLISVMTSSIAADYVMSSILGMDPVFSFKLVGALPSKYYWMIIILGIILGLAGAFYNKALLYVQSLYNKNDQLKTFHKLLIPFILAGILGFLTPQLLGSGDTLVDLLIEGKLTALMIVTLLVGKFAFAIICFGSGAPGGIFFPLLVIGCLIGGLFGIFAVNFLNLDPNYINNFILLAMAGYFTAIVRAPVTGIILIFEMTGSLDVYKRQTKYFYVNLF